jgi:hypothetical protein
VVKLGAMLPGDYFIAAIPIEDWSVLPENPRRLASLVTIGTKVTLAAGDTPVLTLRVVPLPDK